MKKNAAAKSPKASKSEATEATATQLYATPALDKGLDILELLARERDGLTKSEVARALNRTVSEVFRMLLCLERRSYITVTPGDRYVLSLRLFQLVQEHPPTERLLAEAIPRMHSLAEQVHQSCHLGVLEGGKVVILAKADSPLSTGFYVKPGSAVDLTEAATGQVILAHRPADAQQRTLQEWQKETRKPVPPDLHAHLEKIRKRGYEKRASYQVRGVVNISFPILDSNGGAVAALTVPYIQRVHEGVSISQVEKAIAETARAISVAIGAQ